MSWNKLIERLIGGRWDWTSPMATKQQQKAQTEEKKSSTNNK